MTDLLAPQTIAKRPTQKRALARFESVLVVAEELLVEEGLAGFSIPVIADRLGYTRGSVYAYFPTPYAIFNELAKRYLAELEALYLRRAPDMGKQSWRKAIEAIVAQAVEYYNGHPASLIILGGAVTEDAFRAQEVTSKRLGQLGREVLRVQGIEIPSASPDVGTLAVDLGVACFRRSVFEHGSITPAYQEAAVRAMVLFLEPYVQAGKKKGTR